MSLSSKQFQQIMDDYDRIRRENYQIEQDRKEEIYEKIPEIREIDHQIAHIAVERARQMILQPDAADKTSVQQEIQDLSMEKVNLLAIHDYNADYLDPIFCCPDCKDTGFIGEQRCHCFSQKMSSLLLAQSNLQGSSDSNHYNQINLDYYSDIPEAPDRLSPRRNMERIMDKCEHFLHTFRSRPGQNLLICGSTGVGKTYLSTYLGRRVLQQGCRVLYLTAQQFFDNLGDIKFRNDEGQSHTDVLSYILEQDLLIIDDLGTELNNAFTNSELFLCVNERALHCKSTIINTNLQLRQINAQYTERIFSRIMESYQILNMYGRDIRVEKRLH